MSLILWKNATQWPQCVTFPRHHYLSSTLALLPRCILLVLMLNQAFVSARQPRFSQYCSLQTQHLSHNWTTSKHCWSLLTLFAWRSLQSRFESLSIYQSATQHRALEDIKSEVAKLYTDFRLGTEIWFMTSNAAISKPAIDVYAFFFFLLSICFSPW